MKRFSPGRPRLFVIGVVAAWLAMLAVPPWLLGQWRAGRLAELSDPAVQAEWDTFREAMRRESDRSGPVQRKVTWVILVGVLGGFLALLVLGITKPAATGREAAAP
jgi:hypothetical protein